MIPRALAPVLAAAVLAGGCGSTAPSSAPPKREVILYTEAQDRKVGEEAAAQVGGEIGFVDDPELAAYVSAVGKRVAVNAPRRFEYSFKVVDDDAPNAFALPGGFVYVSRGLLVLSNSEDELANVLGHEIVHVAARHAAGRQAVMGSIPGLVQYLALGRVAGYSRDQEREADRLGQGLAALAGYDPAALASFLRGLENSQRLAFGASRLPGFLDTHPASRERAAAASARANGVAWTRRPGIAQDASDYLRRLDGLVVGTSGTEGVFQNERFLHPDLDFTLRFPPGWDTQNTRQAVGAISRERDGMVFLEHQGRGSDPQAAAEKFLAEPEQKGLRADRIQPVKLGGLDAFRMEGRTGSPIGPLAVVITWIAHGDAIYRLTGVSREAISRRHLPVFVNVARSFRPLTPELRESIRETRLRVVPAQPGEDFASLSSRTGNTWDLQQTALANGAFSDAQLRGGQLVKVAVREQYAGDQDSADRSIR